MKRRVLLAFTLLAVLALVVGCGGKQEPTAVAPASVVTAPAVVVAAPVAPAKTAASTLQQIKNRGYIIVGINASNPGFAYLQEDGSYTGFEVDLAKALSVAVFGSPDKLEFRPLTSKERFIALQSGEIDVLIRTATINATRDTELGLDFTTPYFYDGQTFVVRDKIGIDTMEDLEGASIAVLAGSTTETNLAAIMASKKSNTAP